MNKQDWDGSIERRIVIGLIVSTEYIRKVSKVWNPDYILSEAALRISEWCFEYFQKYNEAPGYEIEAIVDSKAKEVDKDTLEEIDQDILPSLEDEYTREGKFNVVYLIDQTVSYFRYRNIKLHTEDLEALAADGNAAAAQDLALAFKSLPVDERDGVLLGSEESLLRLERAFSQEIRRVIEYPGSLGRMWNDQLIREGFISLMASEKRGKSWMLLDMAFKAVNQFSNVVYFDAGDMSEDTLYLRIASYITESPLRDVSEIFLPVKDCLENQTNRCDRKERESTRGLGLDSVDDVNYEVLVDRLGNRKYKSYRPCRNCDWGMTHRGSVFYKSEKVQQLEPEIAKKEVAKYFDKHRGRFKLSRHHNSTLSVREIRRILDSWEREVGFVPDVIIIDYADLLVTGGQEEYRHRVDSVWKELRGLAQERRALVVTATQADARSYEKNRLSLSNFSEDKRKYSHVTAMYGLNQDPKGIEKRMGLMRINELVVRSGTFSEANEVFVLQSLDIGKPCLGSFTRR